jgi:hypothetical protein
MVCEICGADGVLAILPIRQSNGSLITLGCLDCARTRQVWCDRHDRAHTDLGDGQWMRKMYRGRNQRRG